MKIKFSLVAGMLAMIVGLAAWSCHLTLRVAETRREMESLRAQVRELQTTQAAAGETISILRFQIEDMEINQAENRTFYDDYKRRVALRLENECATLIGEEPLHQGRWFITGVRFIDPSLAVITCEDGHHVRETRVRILRPEEVFSLEAIK